YQEFPELELYRSRHQMSKDLGLSARIAESCLALPLLINIIAFDQLCDAAITKLTKIILASPNRTLLLLNLRLAFCTENQRGLIERVIAALRRQEMMDLTTLQIANLLERITL